MFSTDPILPPDPDGLEALHDREYRVRAFRTADDNLLLRGAVRDQKPPGMYVPEDPDPLTMHHMVVEMEVGFPSMEIVRAEATLEIHPHSICPEVEDRYQQLVGLSIARGFINKVRELFGGPRGCTHTNALIQAMAPVAIQCAWSMQASAARHSGSAQTFEPPDADSATSSIRWNLNSCHVWDEEGEFVTELLAGGDSAVPSPIVERLTALGRDPVTWRGGG